MILWKIYAGITNQNNIHSYYNAVIQISGDDGGGAGVTPANPPSNLSNGALGYFSAHTTTVSSLIIR